LRYQSGELTQSKNYSTDLNALPYAQHISKNKNSILIVPESENKELTFIQTFTTATYFEKFMSAISLLTTNTENLTLQNGIEISDGIKDFAKHLQDVHDKSDAAARQVAERAQLIGQKKQLQNEIVKKLKSLEDNVRLANADISKFRNETNGAGNQNLSIREKLEKLNTDLKGFLTEAQSIKEDASQSNFKTIERDAQSLLDALKNSTKKIDKAISG
jgi:chromosome segregation ATPase